MKTTNYLISKKLAEAGFEAETQFYWVKWLEGEPELVHEKEQTPALIEKVGAYDLETILEALPSRRITNENIFIPRTDYYLRLSKEEIWYENECNCDSDESCPVNQRSANFFFSKKIFFFEVSRIKDESLADAAAKMWLKLKKENEL